MVFTICLSNAILKLEQKMKDTAQNTNLQMNIFRLIHLCTDSALLDLGKQCRPKPDVADGVI